MDSRKRARDRDDITASVTKVAGPDVTSKGVSQDGDWEKTTYNLHFNNLIPDATSGIMTHTLSNALPLHDYNFVEVTSFAQPNVASNVPNEAPIQLLYREDLTREETAETQSQGRTVPAGRYSSVADFLRTLLYNMCPVEVDDDIKWTNREMEIKAINCFDVIDLGPKAAVLRLKAFPSTLRYSNVFPDADSGIGISCPHLTTYFNGVPANNQLWFPAVGTQFILNAHFTPFSQPPMSSRALMMKGVDKGTILFRNNQLQPCIFTYLNVNDPNKSEVVAHSIKHPFTVQLNNIDMGTHLDQFEFWIEDADGQIIKRPSATVGYSFQVRIKTWRFIPQCTAKTYFS